MRQRQPRPVAYGSGRPIITRTAAPSTVNCLVASKSPAAVSGAIMRPRPAGVRWQLLVVFPIEISRSHANGLGVVLLPSGTTVIADAEISNTSANEFTRVSRNRLLPDVDRVTASCM